MKRRDVIRRLAAVGATVLRDRGDHTVFVCSCGKHRVPVPRHSEITAGVLDSIQKQMACQDKGWLQ